MPSQRPAPPAPSPAPDGAPAWAIVLELLGALGLLVALPVLDAFQRGADLFVARAIDSSTIIVFAVAVVAGPPVVLAGLVLATRAVHPRAARALHLALLAGALGLVAYRWSWQAAEHRLLSAAALGTVGAAAGWALARTTAARTWLRLVAVAPVAVLVLFLTTAPVSTLLSSGEATVGDADVADPVGVVVLVLDELPLTSLLSADGSVDRARFPSFAALADQATLYRNSSVASPSTPQSVAAIATGRYPDRGDQPPVPAEHPDTLFTLLGGTYAIDARESATRLCPRTACPRSTEPDSLRGLLIDARRIWADGFAPADDPVLFQPPRGELDADRHLAAWIAGVRGGPRTLSFNHVIFPHQPFYVTPSGHRYDGPQSMEGFDDRFAFATTSAAGMNRARHLLQAQVADQLLGDLIDRLEAEGTWDRSLVVVTADHGMRFARGDVSRGLTEDSWPEVLWAPLLIKLPGQVDGIVDDRVARSVDILPTIAEVVGVDVPWALDGRSLLGPPDTDDPDDVRVVADWYLNELHPPAGEPLRFDGREGFARVLDALVDRRADDPLAVFRFGPWGHLLGTATPSPDAAGEAVGGATIEGDGTWSAIDLDDELQPLYLRATADAGTAPVAISIDGVVAAWSDDLDPDSEVVEVAALLPVSLLHDGDHRIELWHIEPTGELRPLVQHRDG